MRCPTCGHENLLGSDVCDNCGVGPRRPRHPAAADDVPRPAPRRAPRRARGSRRRRSSTPATDVDEAIRRMHDDGVDCVLVADGGRLVGIFTDRDAVLKVAGPGRRTRPIATR